MSTYFLIYFVVFIGREGGLEGKIAPYFACERLCLTDEGKAFEICRLPYRWLGNEVKRVHADQLAYRDSETCYECAGDNRSRG